MAKKLVSYMSYIEDKHTYFAVKRALERIEEGKGIHQSVEYCATREKVSKEIVLKYVEDAMSKRKQAGSNDDGGASFYQYLVKWHPTHKQGDPYENSRGTWKIVKAQTQENAKRQIRDNAGGPVAIGSILECKDKQEADRRLAAILRRDYRTSAE